MTVLAQFLVYALVWGTPGVAQGLHRDVIVLTGCFDSEHYVHRSSVLPPANSKSERPISPVQSPPSIHTGATLILQVSLVTAAASILPFSTMLVTSVNLILLSVSLDVLSSNSKPLKGFYCPKDLVQTLQHGPGALFSSSTANVSEPRHHTLCCLGANTLCASV